jgi:D-alanine-D-alanine ligase-like ATP-grasp enzyme
MENAAVALFGALGCRDYARFDFRAGTDGVIRLLEVNPNSSWCWDGKMAIMAGITGELSRHVAGDPRLRVETNTVVCGVGAARQ